MYTQHTAHEINPTKTNNSNKPTSKKITFSPTSTSTDNTNHSQSKLRIYIIHNRRKRNTKREKRKKAKIIIVITIINAKEEEETERHKHWRKKAKYFYCWFAFYLFSFFHTWSMVACLFALLFLFHISRSNVSVVCTQQSRGEHIYTDPNIRKLMHSAMRHIHYKLQPITHIHQHIQHIHVLTALWDCREMLTAVFALDF